MFPPHRSMASRDFFQDFSFHGPFFFFFFFFSARSRIGSSAFDDLLQWHRPANFFLFSVSWSPSKTRYAPSRPKGPVPNRNSFKIKIERGGGVRSCSAAPSPSGRPRCSGAGEPLRHCPARNTIRAFGRMMAAQICWASSSFQALSATFSLSQGLVHRGASARCEAET